MSEGVGAKPSETAMFAALRRALAYKDHKGDRFGPDQFAEYFLPPHFRFFIKFRKIRENTKEKLNGFMPGLHEYMIARTAYFDELFVDALDREVPQIVLLGAGYDTRAYRFADRNKGTKIFELDIASTQAWKQKCIQKAKLPIPASVSFVPINFNADVLENVLAEAGYDADLPALFIWEGVSYYLQAESVHAMLVFVRDFAHAESRIAFDYVVPLTDENKNDFGVASFIETMRSEHGDEALLFSIVDGGVEVFLKERGLKLIEHLDNKEIEDRFLMDDGVLLGQITAHFRFVIAKGM